MLRKSAVTWGTLTPLAALAIGELAEQYDNSKKDLYAKQQLLKWRSAFQNQKTSEESESKPAGVSTWLGNTPPRFPYLLSISAGDDPEVVTSALLQGAQVLGSYGDRTLNTLNTLTTPSSGLQLLIQNIATRYSALKTALNDKVSSGDFLRVGAKVGPEDVTMNALLKALRDLKCSEQRYDERKEASEADEPANLQTNQLTAPPVFLLWDFDSLSDLEIEKMLRWVNQVSDEGLAYVIILTTTTLTPSKVQWLQARHQIGFGAAKDFVCILLRATNGLVDSSSGEDKLYKIAKSHDLTLINKEKNTHVLETDRPIAITTQDDNTETGVILMTAGNWWSDIDEICRRLNEKKLNTVTLPEERLAVIREVCDDFLQETEIELLKAMHLDGNLHLPSEMYKVNVAELSSFSNYNSMVTPKILNALETWKCFETLTGVVPVTSASSLVNFPQQLLNQKGQAPLNCVSPVEALLPFNYREDGEHHLLDLIDQHLLFLRPKNAVEIGVIPCQESALISPCWIQIRPVVKKAFENIHRSDTYFKVILDIERFAANIEMRKEVEQYEREIAERRKAFFDMKQDFTVRQSSMTSAEKAQRKAELALIDVELQMKGVYLEKLRSLLTE